jgi:hypothetical protein
MAESQQVSVEAAFPIYRKRCGELFDENLMLRGLIQQLEDQITELEAERQSPPASGLPASLVGAEAPPLGDAR